MRSADRFWKTFAAVLLVILAAPSVFAHAEYRTVELPNGEQIPTRHFASPGSVALLWLPSEYGVRDDQESVAAAVSELGYDVWLADLHSAYFVAPGRDSVGEFPVTDVVELAKKILATGKKKMVLMAAGKGAALALQTGRALQLRDGTRGAIRGFVLLSPYLSQGRPEYGQDDRVLSIVHETNLPVLYLQPTLSEKYWRAEDLSQELGLGGSDVTFRTLIGVQSGFEARPDDELTAQDLAARRDLPALLHRAMQNMTTMNIPPHAAPAGQREDHRSQSVVASRLSPYSGPQDLPDIVLDDLEGKRHRLSSYRGKVVLINFWATWCPPCVKEIPSLAELNETMAEAGFRLLAINVGEAEEAITRFLRDKPSGFPVLLDRDGEALKSWKVYAYPSNYLLDRQGRVRYAYYGALDWMAPEVVAVIEKLVAEKQPTQRSPRASR